MTPHQVKFTATASRHVQREKAWWLENRDYLDVFTTEFERVFRVLSLMPGTGTMYPQAQVPGLRRLYVRKVSCHIYYTFDQDEVIVRAFWGARLHRGPQLRR